MCSHMNLVFDHHEGTEVCTDCGIVVSSLLFHNEARPPITIHYDVFNGRHNEFTDYVSSLNLPYSFISFCENELKSLNKLNVGDHSIKTKHAYVLYNVLKTQHCPRTLKEIASVTGATTTKIWKLQSTVQSIVKSAQLFDDVSPADILERTCSYLNTPFDVMDRIKQELDNLPDQNNHPATIVGAFIYKNTLKTKHQVSLKRIATTLGISVMSIQRYIKKYLKK